MAAPRFVRLSVRLLPTTALLVAACTTAGPTAPATSPSPVGPSASVVIAVESPSSAPSRAPSSTPTSAPSASVDPSVEPEPTPDPTPIPSDLATCGVGQEGFDAHSDEIPRTFHFGGATIEYATAGFGLRNGTFSGDDEIPGGIGLEPDEIAVRVDPGTHILLRADGVTIQQLSASQSAWSRVRFEDGFASLGGDPVALVWRSRPDGSISVSAPTTPGDYAVEFLVGWHSTCLQGSGTAYGRIKVNG